MNTTPEQEFKKELIAGSRWVHYRADTFLLRQGELGDKVVFILDGQVKVERSEPDGKCSILAFRGPGEILGRTAVLRSCRRFASVEALKPCKVAVISADAYLEFMAKSSLAVQVAQHAQGRLIESMIVQGKDHPLARLVFALTCLADRNWNGVGLAAQVVLHATRTDLGRHLRVGRNTVSTLLGQLEGFGVEAHRNAITITDLPKLRAVAEKLGI
ncbi:Crp/Fnr family transcriptional regulator [Streptosporangium sp. NBC_01469]|uniref:Crp/Fnr family transcriptional regulator n=1 Tax=Streptosporangium sp. NBC_01469 TaxID=2903898 RepID=UPI002E2ADDD4|nr:Crp/Fnr family transcriptional regulator [Streptosporangium sp. NBC_01469]